MEIRPNEAFDAVKNNELPKLEEWLRSPQLHINAYNPEGLSLLHLACKLDRIECLKRILLHPELDVNFKCKGETVTIQREICTDGMNSMTVDRQIYDQNHNDFSFYRMTALHIAALRLNIECIKLLLSHKDIKIDIKDTKGRIPLDIARAQTTRDNTEACQLLDLADDEDLTKISNVNGQDVSGNTFLHRAIASRKMKAVRELLSRPNINIHIQNNAGVTPFKMMMTDDVFKNNEYIREIFDFSLFMADRNGLTKLHKKVKEGDIPALVTILNNKFLDVNIRSKETGHRRYTALHYAAEQGLTECVKHLLHHKNINVNVQTYSGFTPIMLAAQNGHTECVQLLLQNKNINVNIQIPAGNHQFHSAFLLAFNNNHQDCVMAILNDKNMDVNVANGEGRTLIHVAAATDNTELMKLLVANNRVKVNLRIWPQQELEFYTGLHVAAYYNHPECIKILLSHRNIDVNLRQTEGYTPLHIAAINGYSECVAALLTSPNINTRITNFRGFDAETEAFLHMFLGCRDLIRDYDWEKENAKQKEEKENKE